MKKFFEFIKENVRPIIRTILVLGIIVGTVMISFSYCCGIESFTSETIGDLWGILLGSLFSLMCVYMVLNPLDSRTTPLGLFLILSGLFTVAFAVYCGIDGDIRSAFLASTIGVTFIAFGVAVLRESDSDNEQVMYNTWSWRRPAKAAASGWLKCGPYYL